MCLGFYGRGIFKELYTHGPSRGIGPKDENANLKSQAGISGRSRRRFKKGKRGTKKVSTSAKRRGSLGTPKVA